MTLAGLALAICATSARADEKADIAAVEREIRATDESIAIHKRAKKRAELAVGKSSWGKKCDRSMQEFQKVNDAFKKSRAYREYLGPDKFDRIAFKRAWVKKNGSSDYRRMLREADRESGLRAKRYEKARKPVKPLFDAMMATGKVCDGYIRLMTGIFLRDEIKKATAKKLHSLRRELEKIRKGYTKI